MLIPRPKQEYYANQLRTISGTLSVYAPDSVTAKAAEALRILAEDIGITVLPCTQSPQADIQFFCRPNPDNKSEFYDLKITDDSIHVEFADFLGGRNAAATLLQLIKYQNGEFQLPVCQIQDWPDCSWRGLMLDTGHWFQRPVKEIKDLIRQLAMGKYTIFHLHLMDWVTYGLRSEVYPQLWDDTHDQYTLEEMREIVAFADSLGLECIPELEPITHASFIMQHFPELLDDTETLEPNIHAVCVGNDKLFEIFENLVQELGTVFPSPIVHIGGDELYMYDLAYVDRKDPDPWPTWHDCKRCKALAKQLNIHMPPVEEVNARFADKSILEKGVEGFNELYLHTVRRLHDILAKHGKRLMMWNDVIDTTIPIDLPRDILIHFWRIAMPARGPYIGCTMENFLEAGFEVVNSHYEQTYFGYDYALAFRPEVPLNEWYPSSYPTMDPKYDNLMLGGEPCAWGDYPHFRYTMPSALAFYADRLWNRSPWEYSKEFQIAATRLLLGPKVADDYDAFEALGGYVLPRDVSRDKDAYIRKARTHLITISAEEVAKSAQVLHNLEDADTCVGRMAAIYAECTDWAYDVLTGKEVPPKFD